MMDSLVALPRPAVPPEVQDFAADKGIGPYLTAVIELARQSFPSSALWVSLGRDAEDDGHQYIALDVDVSGRTTEELVAAQQKWSAGLGRICPPRHAVYFVLGWR
jgi:hypothetical protein